MPACLKEPITLIIFGIVSGNGINFVGLLTLFELLFHKLSEFDPLMITANDMTHYCLKDFANFFVKVW